MSNRKSNWELAARSWELRADDAEAQCARQENQIRDLEADAARLREALQQIVDQLAAAIRALPLDPE